MDAIVDWDRDAPQWLAVLAAAGGCGSVPAPLHNALWPLYGPLTPAKSGEDFIIGQLGQSLDGRIATPTGHSHYINGKAAIVHLHRLRALVDAVVVGIGTVVADDPQLNVRHAAMNKGTLPPARVVIDPSGRLASTAKCLTEDGARRIVLRGMGADHVSVSGVETLHVPSAGGMKPADILAALRGIGLRRILVEGGAHTLSRFLQAGCLNRLHIMTAPMIIGSGPIGLHLADIDNLSAALRPRVASFALPEGDILFDCAF